MDSQGVRVPFLNPDEHLQYHEGFPPIPEDLDALFACPPDARPPDPSGKCKEPPLRLFRTKLTITLFSKYRRLGARRDLLRTSSSYILTTATATETQPLSLNKRISYKVYVTAVFAAIAAIATIAAIILMIWAKHEE